MIDRKEEMDRLRDVVRIEREALEHLEARMGEPFLKAVDLIYSTSCSSHEKPCGGRLIICGLGKSGFIARKIAATMTSTGTPAFFVHPIEGAHGDFGVIQQGDVALVISKSGAGEELNTLLPWLKRNRVPVIALTHDLESPLAKHSEVLLDASIHQEACPNGVAPTTSSTLALVVGDTLAVGLMHRRGFTKEDFARFHPAGALGRKLLLTAEAALPEERELPLLEPHDNLGTVIVTLTSGRCGAALVMAEGRLLGLITDGDLRRHMLDDCTISKLSAKDLMSLEPRRILGSKLAVEALAIMNESKIQQLVVDGPDGQPLGVLHLHDLLAQGIR
jgi:arabinose-5-phosphate isomerase